MNKRNKRDRRTQTNGFTTDGFTIVELLVVIAVIGILAALLIPTISSVRAAARDANTRNTVQQLMSAINAYHADYRGYPGPLSNTEIETGQPANSNNPDVMMLPADFTPDFVYPGGSLSFGKVAMSENLTLGLLGGLKMTMISNNVYRTTYDPKLVGLGPQSLNPLRPNRGTPYFAEGPLSWHTEDGHFSSTGLTEFTGANIGKKTGRFSDQVGYAFDSVIPEFVDRGITPMPIIYIRPRITGAFTSTSPETVTRDPADLVAKPGNPVVVKDNNADGGAAISLNQFKPYANTGDTPNSNWNIGEDVVGWHLGSTDRKHGLNLPDGVVNNPVVLNTPTIDAYSYFKNPASARSEIRAKDSFILIAPGRDRRYGTLDDITSFGKVGG